MSSEDKKEVIEKPICKVCKENQPDLNYAFPLCQNCRKILKNRPFPNWIKAVMFVIAALVLYSGFKFPIACKAGIAQKAGKAAEAIADYSNAILEYQKVLALFPESQEHKARLAVCYIKSGEIQQAANLLKNINEKSLSKEVISELNTLINNKQNNNN